MVLGGHGNIKAGKGFMALNVTINGEDRQLDAPVNIRELVSGLGLDPAKIAVERNLEIVPRSAYANVMVGQGDRLEIVHFIGGGNAPVESPRSIRRLSSPVEPIARASSSGPANTNHMPRMRLPWRRRARRSSLWRSGA
jgi:thiamine biosynthesis protein ThiS